MKKFVPCCLLVVAAIVAVSQIAVDGSEVPAETKDVQEVVVHVSHSTDDLHRCFMGLKLATILQKSEANVTLFLDIEGVRLADEHLPLNLTWGPSPTPLSDYYDSFVAAGGRILVCPHCAKVANITDSDLRPNAKIGTSGDIGMLLMNADKIMDY